jgi:hypothetical protein
MRMGKIYETKYEKGPNGRFVHDVITKDKQLEAVVLDRIFAVIAAHKLEYSDIACLAGSIVRESRVQQDKREVLPTTLQEDAEKKVK